MPTFNILLILCIIAIAVTQSVNVNINAGDNTDEELKRLVSDQIEPLRRVKRGLFWDFFQKALITKNLLVEQYQDTTNTLNDVYNVLNQQFNDPVPDEPGSTNARTSAGNLIQGETTTPNPVNISRFEFGRILGRNYRGLKRLVDIEINDALNQTHSNLNDYRREADQQFANSLPLEKKKLIKAYIG